MYTINLKVNGNGTVEKANRGPLHIATKGSKNCVKLKFNVDSNIEGTYRYVKFYHPKGAVIQRLSNDEVVVSSNVLVHSGIWLLSFISSTSTISYTEANGSYIFSSIPIECDVADGLLNIGIAEENLERIEELENQIADDQSFINSIFGMTYDTLVIPDYVTSIGSYFMYNSSKSISRLFIGKNVRTIGNYAFYDTEIDEISFDANSRLDSLGDYSFSHVRTGTVAFPASLSSLGRYAFNGGTVGTIRFMNDSNVRTLNANTFNNVTIDALMLPYGMTKFASNGYVIRNCRINYLWIPSSITTTIPQTAFHEATGIKYITLDENFNVSANFSNCTELPHDCLVEMLYALKDRSGQTSLNITIGATNLAKLNASEIAIATNKNWTIS